jgi:hypothetical protein
MWRRWICGVQHRRWPLRPGAAFSTPHNKVIRSASHPSGWPTPCSTSFSSTPRSWRATKPVRRQSIENAISHIALVKALHTGPLSELGSGRHQLERLVVFKPVVAITWCAQAHVVGDHQCVCRDRLRDKSQSLGEVRGRRHHQRGPSTLAGSARADGLPMLAVAICYVALKKPLPA